MLSTYLDKDASDLLQFLLLLPKDQKPPRQTRYSLSTQLQHTSDSKYFGPHAQKPQEQLLNYSVFLL